MRLDYMSYLRDAYFFALKVLVSASIIELAIIRN